MRQANFHTSVVFEMCKTQVSVDSKIAEQD